MSREVCHHFRPIDEFCQNCHEPDQFIDFETVKRITLPAIKEYDLDGQLLKTGVKKDEGKARFELVPFDVVEAVARILTQGAKKYDSRNWEKGIQYGRVFGAALRHLSLYWNAHLVGSDGINRADGTESHLDHAITELMFLSAYEKRGMTQFDDRPGK